MSYIFIDKICKKEKIVQNTSGTIQCKIYVNNKITNKPGMLIFMKKHLPHYMFLLI